MNVKHFAFMAVFVMLAAGFSVMIAITDESDAYSASAGTLSVNAGTTYSNEEYRFTLSSTIDDIEVSIDNGTAVPGMTFDVSENFVDTHQGRFVYSGTPTTPGTYQVTASGIDNDGNDLTLTLTVLVRAPAGGDTYSPVNSAGNPYAQYSLSATVLDEVAGAYVYNGASISITITSEDGAFPNMVDLNGYYGSSVTAGGLTATLQNDAITITGNITQTVVVTYSVYDGWDDSEQEKQFTLRVVSLSSSGVLTDTVPAGTSYSHQFHFDICEADESEIFDLRNASGSVVCNSSRTVQGTSSYNGLTATVSVYILNGWVQADLTVSGTPAQAGDVYANAVVQYEYQTEFGWESASEMNSAKITVTNPSHTHTVNYSANGGSGSMSPTVVTDANSGSSEVTLDSCGFTKSGYHFVGWKVGNTTYQPGQSVSVGANATVTATAQWEQNTLTLGTVAKQYVVAGKSVSFNASATSNPSGATITFAKSNASSGLNVSVSGNVVTCSAANAGTYTFTLTAIASGYTSSSTTVTVQVVPVLAFTNSPSAGALNA